MKNIFKTFFVCIIGLFVLIKATNAQCTPPDLTFASPILVEGVALQEGAVYKFLNVSPGIDCFITLVKFNGGATLVSMENVGLGYFDAWQPIIDGPGAPVGNKSWIDWKISFKTTAGLNYNFPCLAICAIDVDGDNGNIGEFLESGGQASYELAWPTVLTVTDNGDGRIEAQGPVYNRVGIDTFSLDVRINYYFDGLDSINLKIGQTVLGPGTGGATARYNSIYFKKVVLNPFHILPLSFIDVKAERVSSVLHNISWKLAGSSKPSVRFEIEYSEDNIKWQQATSLQGENGKTDYNIFYRYYGSNTIYYRIKALENGKSSISRVDIIKKIQHEPHLKVTPNPADDYINVYLSETNIADTKKIQLIDFNGKKIIDISCRQQSIDINTSNLTSGYYILNVLDKAKIFSSQVLVKHPF